MQSTIKIRVKSCFKASTKANIKVHSMTNFIILRSVATLDEICQLKQRRKKGTHTEYGKAYKNGRMWIVLVSFFLLYSILCNRLDSHLPSASKNNCPNPCNTPQVFDCVLPMFQTPQSKSFFSVPRIKELVMLHHGLW